MKVYKTSVHTQDDLDHKSFLVDDIRCSLLEGSLCLLQGCLGMHIQSQKAVNKNKSRRSVMK